MPRPAPRADDPALAAFRLGGQHYGAGAWALAAEAFAEAARLNPGWAAALTNLGASLRKAGRPDEAAQALEQALALQPTDPVPHNNLGNLRADQGRLDDAIALFRRALALKPDFIEAMDGLAHRLGTGEEALLWRRRRVALTREDAEGWRLLAETLNGAKLWSQALIAARQAEALAPQAAAGPWQQALALDGLGRTDEALEALDRAIAIDPADGRLRLQRAQSLTTAKRLDEALAVISALRETPMAGIAAWEIDIAEARTGFLAGDYARAWPAYESRWRLPTLTRPPFKAPPWKGEDLKGKRLLLWSEQGAGDAIQFVRIAPALKALGAEVVVVAPPPVADWLRTAPGVDRCVTAAPADIDVQAPMLTAAGLLDWRPETLGGAPYLKASGPPPPVLAAARGLKVGVAWSGNPAHVNDRRRSLTAEAFMPFAAIPGVRLFSLHVDSGSIGALEPFVTDLAPHMRGWRPTATVLAALDLVICVDTGVGHAAGALGRPTWVLLSRDCDWRWEGDGESTGWYANHRLLRQTRLDDWSHPLDAALTALQLQAEL